MGGMLGFLIVLPIVSLSSIILVSSKTNLIER
jgi:hypothetical protein